MSRCVVVPLLDGVGVAGMPADLAECLAKVLVADDVDLAGVHRIALVGLGPHGSSHDRIRSMRRAISGVVQRCQPMCVG